MENLTASTQAPGNIVELYLVGKSINKKEVLQPYPGELSVTDYLIEQLKGVSVKRDSANC